MSYNTVVVPGTCKGGVNFPTGCSANFGIACKQDNGSNSNTGFTADGNYVDWSGMIAALTNGYKCPGAAWGTKMQNIDLNTVQGVLNP